ncbi:MAG: sporulation protein YqfD [Ruminococcus sp.]|nr:sporulation protein YqfD [Ruminococcus sp.]
MFFGSVTFEADGSSADRIYRFISSNRLPAKDIHEAAGKVYLTVPAGLRKTFNAMFDIEHISYSVTGERGISKLVKRLLAKKGLLIGTLLSFLAALYFSGTVLCIEIQTDDPEVRKQVTAMLYEHGVRAGARVSSLDLTKTERAVRDRLDKVSWIGITVEGCKVIADVMLSTEKPEFAQKRLPTNQIACENGVVEKIELTDGQLVTTVGSGVRKGDILVSGKIVNERVYYKNGEERHDIYTRYARSIAAVYGTFERTERFFQPYHTEKRIDSDDSSTRYMLRLFDAELPLFFSSDPQTCIEVSSESRLSFMGLELPIAFVRTELTGYSFAEVPISEREARLLAAQKAELYERNFLSEYELKDRKTEYEVTDEGVTMTVNYTLYGKLSEEVEFFIDK